MIKVAWWATGIFALSAAIGFGVVSVAIAVGLFVAGFVLMAMTLVIGAGRSRTDLIDIGGLFYSQAPTQLKLAFGAQILIGLATAPLRASAAFGVFVPVFGLGLCGLWGARHGRFPARET